MALGNCNGLKRHCGLYLQDVNLLSVKHTKDQLLRSPNFWAITWIFTKCLGTLGDFGEDYVAAVDHVIRIVGEENVGIGTDFTQDQDDAFFEYISHDKGYGWRSRMPLWPSLVRCRPRFSQ